MREKYFRNLYLFCSILGIVPFYSFKRSRLSKKILNKIWLIILLVYKFLLIMGYFVMQFPEFEREYSLITIKVLEHPSHLSYWMMPFSTVLILLAYNTKKWEEFLNKFRHINDVLPWRSGKHRYVKHVLNCSLNLILLTYVISDREYFNTNESVSYKIWHVLYSNFEELFWLYTNIFANEIILNLKDRYEALNEKLVQIIDISVENRFMSKDLVFVTVKQIQKIKLLYRDITDLAERSNSLVGWPIFCLMTYTLLDTLSILNSLIVQQELAWIGSDSIELFVIIMYNIYVALSCDFTSYEGRKIIKLCYNLRENFPLKSPIRDELLELAEQAKYFSPRFVSVGLFNINRRILLSMVATITTYLIIIIQFNNVL